MLISSARSLLVNQRRGLLALQRSPLPATAPALFRTSPQRSLHPILYALVKPLSRLASVLAGRAARVWWKRIGSERREAIRKRVQQNKYVLVSAGASLTVFGLYAYESHVVTCPYTGRKKFVALTPQQMQMIGKVEFDMAMRGLGEEGLVLPQTHPYAARVVRMANRIIMANEELKDKNWTVTVVEDPTQNAMVLPSGNIFVHTGMMQVCDNDDQLGVVLAHEFSHVVLNHVAEKLSYINLIYVSLLMPMAVLWAFIPVDGIALITDWFIHKFIELTLELPYRDVRLNLLV